LRERFENQRGRLEKGKKPVGKLERPKTERGVILRISAKTRKEAKRGSFRKKRIGFTEPMDELQKG